MVGDDIHGFVNEDAAHIVPDEVHRVFADVGPDDERVVVGGNAKA